MTRHFTLEQAQRLLPEIEGLLRDAMYKHAEFQEAELELRRMQREVELSGGRRVDGGHAAELKQKHDANAQSLAEALTTIHDMGVQVKDLEIGLIVFPTRYRGEEVLLCWRLGEPRIEWWHSPADGFRGRKPINREFVESHQGDREN